MNADLRDSVVLVTSRDPEEAGFGTAFVIDRRETQTYLLTCAHVVEMVGGAALVRAGGLPAKVVAIGEKSSTDLAVLVVTGLLDKSVLPLRRSVQESSHFTTSGYRKSAGTIQRRESTGKLGQQRVDLEHQGTLLPAWDLEITGGARLESGCSGSPIVDQTGAVVGVAIHQQDDIGRQGLAIAISALPCIWPNMPPALLPVDPIPTKPVPWWQFWQRPQAGDRSLISILLASLGVAGLLLIGHSVGSLQGVELKVYDAFLQTKAKVFPAAADDRLMLITFTEDDFRKFGESSSIPDNVWVALIDALTEVEAKAIGFDIYRPEDANPPPSQELLERFEFGENLVAVCKPGETKSPSSNLQEDNLGFSDAVRDPDKIIRRQLLLIQHDDKSCNTSYSFALQLASWYLSAQNIERQLKDTPDGKGQIILGRATFTPLNTPFGGYQQLAANSPIDTRGFQILLNYRVTQDNSSHQGLNIAKRSHPLSDLIESPNRITRATQSSEIQFRPEKIAHAKDRIVLVGIMDRTKDDHYTPFNNEQTRGVILQAQMVSQILRAAKGEEPLLSAMPWWGDAFWISGWTLVGGVLVWKVRSRHYLIIGLGVLLVGLVGTSFWLLQSWAYWVPVMPPAIALIVIIIPVASKLIPLPGSQVH